MASYAFAGGARVLALQRSHVSSRKDAGSECGDRDLALL